MESRRAGRRRMLIITAILLAAAVFALFAYYEFSLATVEYSVNIGTRFRAAQLSDLHGNDWGGTDGELYKRIKAARPDVIFITGDSVTRTDKRLDETAARMAEFFRALNDVAPVYMVWGNHETKLPANKKAAIKKAFADAGAVILDNEITAVCGAAVAGLNASDKKGAARALAELDGVTGPKLILYHFPHDIDLLAGRCAAVLSGHTHGGQVRVPLWGRGVLAPGQGLFPKYDGGRFTVGETTLIVSRGLGDSFAPVRLFNRHELVLVNFE